MVAGEGARLNVLSEEVESSNQLVVEIRKATDVELDVDRHVLVVSAVCCNLSLDERLGHLLLTCWTLSLHGDWSIAKRDMNTLGWNPVIKLAAILVEKGVNFTNCLQEC